MARPGANPFQPKQPPLSQKQRELWERLNKYIMANGGWIVSQPDISPIRFECPLDSDLPETLRQAGHQVVEYGTHERLMPITETLKEHGLNTTVTRQHVAPIVVSVFEFRLPVG
jgi:hypothetical protein